MKTVNVTSLRQNLPEYLASATRGESVRVTSRGRVIAEIVPPSLPDAEVKAARARLRNSMIRFDRPTDPVFDPDEWDVNR